MYLIKIYLNYLQHIKKLIANEKVRHEDAAKLVMLYALHYENNSNNDTSGLIEILKKRGVSDRLVKVRPMHQQLTKLNLSFPCSLCLCYFFELMCVQMVRAVLEYGGSHARQSDLFGHQDAVVQVTKRFFKVI